jgi:hypothetical protein
VSGPALFTPSLPLSVRMEPITTPVSDRSEGSPVAPLILSSLTVASSRRI